MCKKEGKCRNESSLCIYICESLDNYIKQRTKPHSLLEIFLDQLDAYVVVKSPGFNISFTDY